MEQKINGLAIDYLEMLGNYAPDQKQIDMVEELLSHSVITCKIHFDTRLTQREVMTLYLTALGKTSKESAKMLGIESCTVECHRAEIKRKLDCRNMSHAVYKGIIYGYIPAMNALLNDVNQLMPEGVG